MKCPNCQSDLTIALVTIEAKPSPSKVKLQCKNCMCDWHGDELCPRCQQCSTSTLTRKKKSKAEKAAAKVDAVVPARSSNGAGLDRMKRTLLTGLAQWDKPMAEFQLLRLCRYYQSGHSVKALRDLEAEGHVLRVSSQLSITAAGGDALGTLQPLERGKALLDWWIGSLGTMGGRILRVLANEYPDWVSEEDLYDRTNYQPSGHFVHALRHMRDLGMVGRDALVLTEAFMTVVQAPPTPAERAHA